MDVAGKMDRTNLHLLSDRSSAKKRGKGEQKRIISQEKQKLKEKKRRTTGKRINQNSPSPSQVVLISFDYFWHEVIFCTCFFVREKKEARNRAHPDVGVVY